MVSNDPSGFYYVDLRLVILNIDWTSKNADYFVLTIYDPTKRYLEQQ